MKVSITIEDGVDDKVNTNIEFDPPCDNDTPHTGATILAFAAIEALTKKVAEFKKEEAASES